jgi:putative CocE/NonD family hydrolase
MDFGVPVSAEYRKTILAPWFAYWLKGKGKLDLAEATTYQAGTNAWQKHDSWPPRSGVTTRRLYFHQNHELSFDRPTDASADAFDSFLSDPANPVPYRKRPIPPTFGQGSSWSRWLMDDQRFLKDRSDVPSWQTPPLTDDVVISGNIAAHLLASTTGSDADWVVKLIDVYPEAASDSLLAGYQLMVANDILRGRFRKSYERPEAITPNRVEEFVVDLHTQDYRFKKGHRIMVQVQSSWFPLIDRNPQTFVANIFEAKDSDFRAQTHKIFRSRESASYVEVSVVSPR